MASEPEKFPPSYPWPALFTRHIGFKRYGCTIPCDGDWDAESIAQRNGWTWDGWLAFEVSAPGWLPTWLVIWYMNWKTRKYR